MNRKSKVSVITVVYNDKDNFITTLKSITSQNYDNLEYIVIDAKSTDGTIDIINKYKDTIDHWVSESDNGIYEAMNKGVNLATGEWINFMNAGDTFAGKSIVSDFIDAVHDATDLYFGDINYFESSSSDNAIYREAMGIKNIYEIIPCCHQALFAKKSLLKKYPFNTEYKIAADYDFLLQCYTNKYEFQYENKAICNFIGGGIHQEQFIKTRIESMMILNKFLKKSEDVLDSRYYKSLIEYSNSKNKNKNKNFEFSKNINQLYLQLLDIQNKYSKIAIFGYGVITKTILSILKNNTIVIIEQNKELQNTNSYPHIVSVENIHKYDYDVIIISVLGREDEIEKILKQNNIHEKYIIRLML